MTGSIALLQPLPGEATHRLGGWPKVYTDDAIARALWEEGHGNLSAAAKILKCSRRTICDALGRSSMLREIKWECEGRIYDIAYQTIFHYVEMDDLSASIFMVRKLWPKFGCPNAGDELKGADVAVIKTKSVDIDDLGGKPKVYTDDAIAHALWEGHGIISEAAKILKCSRRTICDALARSPMLQKIIWKCERQIFNIAYENLCRYVEIGNLTAANFLVRLLGPKFGSPTSEMS